MAVRLLTVESCAHVGDGLVLSPGVPMEAMSSHEELRQLMSDGPVELRLPDGSVRATRLVRFGASVFKGKTGASTFPATRMGRHSPSSLRSHPTFFPKTYRRELRSGWCDRPQCCVVGCRSSGGT
jgi:hypothetical protein